METILKSEIFFFITSISIIIITTVLIISGAYFINIMKNLSNISDKLKKAADNTESNIEEIGKIVKESPAFTFVFGKKQPKNKKQKEK